MQFEKFLEKFDEDDTLLCYHPTAPIKIFDCKLDNCECEINISKQLSAEEALPVLTDYLNWLASCEGEVRSYFVSKLGEKLPVDWYRSIEVYSASITFVKETDFVATVCFGESIFSDHIVELYFEGHEIVDDILNG